MRASKITILLEIITLILVALFAGIAVMPAPSPPKVSVRLVSYTNDAAGATLLVFAVTNLGPSMVYVYHPMMLGMVYMHSTSPIWHTMLDRSASASFTIAEPTNQPPWKLILDADPDVGVVRAIKHRMTWIARRMPYTVESDWIQVKK